MGIVVQAVLLGMLVALAGTLPRNLLFALNLRYANGVPWAVPLVAAYLYAYWRYLRGDGPPASTSRLRRTSLRAPCVPARVWAWSLVAGALGIVALVLALKIANRFVALPAQTLPADLAAVPPLTVLALLLAAAPVAGIVEEAAFRGYMQGSIERAYGLPLAVLVTGTAFAVAHLDFTLALWPYYVAVAAIYGAVTHYARSILPAVVLHTGGNTYSNLDLWLHGRAEWQAAATPSFVWQSGVDAAFVATGSAFAVATLASLWAFAKLAQTRPRATR